MRGTRPMILYRVLRWTMSFYFRARMKIRFEGEENVPKRGPSSSFSVTKATWILCSCTRFAPASFSRWQKVRYSEPGSWLGLRRG